MSTSQAQLLITASFINDRNSSENLEKSNEINTFTDPEISRKNINH